MKFYSETMEQQTLEKPPGINDIAQVTVVLRNIACRFTQEDVKRTLDECGLQGKFSLVYAPRIESRNSNFGYAFVRFRTPAYAAECASLLNGKVFGASNTKKLCQVEIAEAQESIEETLRRRRRRQNGMKPELLLVNDPLPTVFPVSGRTESTVGSVPSGDFAMDERDDLSEASSALLAEDWLVQPPPSSPPTPPAAHLRPEFLAMRILLEGRGQEMWAGASGFDAGTPMHADSDVFCSSVPPPMSYLTEPRYVQVASF